MNDIICKNLFVNNDFIKCNKIQKGRYLTRWVYLNTILVIAKAIASACEQQMGNNAFVTLLDYDNHFTFFNKGVLV